MKVCIKTVYDISLMKLKHWKVLNKNALLYFHGVSFVVFSFTLLNRGHFSELCLHGFFYSEEMDKARNAWCKKPNILAQNGRAAASPTQNPSGYRLVSFQFASNTILALKPTPRGNNSGHKTHTFTTRRTLKTRLVTLPPLPTKPHQETTLSLSIHFFRNPWYP